MIQVQTELEIADNSGARRAECIRVLGGTRRRYAFLGDVIVVAIKDAIPRGRVKKGDVMRAVVVRVRQMVARKNGERVSFDQNAVVLLNKQGDVHGTRIFGPVARELRDKHSRIVSLAPEVL